jgi:hypothetical protein
MCFDAGEARRLGIVARRVDVTAVTGAVEHVPSDDRQGDQQESAQHNARSGDVERDAHHLQERRVRLEVVRTNGFALRVERVQGADDAPGPKRNNKGGHFQPRDE